MLRVAGLLSRRGQVLRHASTNTPKFSIAQLASESFLSPASTPFIEEVYQKYLKDPTSVHASWGLFFNNTDRGVPVGQAYPLGPNLSAAAAAAAAAGGGAGGAGAGGIGAADAARTRRVQSLIRAYQVRGHEKSNTCPLGLYKDRPVPKELTLEEYGWSEADLDTIVTIPNEEYMEGFLSIGKPMPLRELIGMLQRTYCGSIGYEYMHISSREKCNWLRERIEATPKPYSAEKKKDILEKLLRADLFEATLRHKYPSQKGFGLEGAWSFVNCLHQVVESFKNLKGEHVVLGMPHRGRLCVLTQIMNKPYEAIFKEFNEGGIPVHRPTEDFTFMGDVKYHLGCSTTTSFPDGSQVYLTMLPNPSHLEAVYPVTQGKCRARQDFSGDTDRTKCLPIAIHGDASVAGQGVVAEMIDMSGLKAFSTGGTIHIVVNNRIGFTTNPRDARTSIYPTDIAKSVDAPIFHVNGDDVEAVCRVAELAVEWRQTFHTDVFIDIVCYRRMGHNEGDQADFTQPYMYSLIKKAVPTYNQYLGQLVKEAVISAEEGAALKAKNDEVLKNAFNNASKFAPKDGEIWGARWENKMVSPRTPSPKQVTAIAPPKFDEVLKVLSTIPDTFALHPKLRPVFAKRDEMLAKGLGVDWGTAEQLAFGSLLSEGFSIRLTGQDVERGTFSHRHAILQSQTDHGADHPNGKYMPLAHVKIDAPSKPLLLVANSSLSEYGVLGFEYGFSLENPDCLVLWEAQFGDFVNGAQITIDQFIVSGESKWKRQSPLTLLLPHGYEHGGPEHSSCRPERFLQMFDDNPDSIDTVDPIQSRNFQLVNASTPSQYFHVLRRQLHRKFRKPLIVVSPKKLLRHPLATSAKQDFVNGMFREWLPEGHQKLADGSNSIQLVSDDKIRNVVFCTGKVFYDLFEAREAMKVNDVALVRLEQIAPFPYEGVRETLKKYKNARVVWCQEEPLNQGFYSFVQPRIVTAYKSLLPGSKLDTSGHYNFVNKYVDTGNFKVFVSSRPSAPQPACGSSKESELEQKRLIEGAFSTY